MPSTFIARLAALDDLGRGWIVTAHAPAAELAASESRRAPARSTVVLLPAHIGREVLVTLANTPPEPVIVGVLTTPGDIAANADPGSSSLPAIDLVVERRRIVFEAKSEVVLRCGEGSITLTAEGKVQIRGLDVVSSAERTQRIRGGSVRIN